MSYDCLLIEEEATRRKGPEEAHRRYEVISWLMWQMGGLGPMLGTYGHFKLYAPEPVPYALKRYGDEANRLYAVLNDQLEGATLAMAEQAALDAELSLEAAWPFADFMACVPDDGTCPVALGFVTPELDYDNHWISDASCAVDAWPPSNDLPLWPPLQPAVD